MKLKFWKIGLCAAIVAAPICLFGCSSQQPQEQEQPSRQEQAQQEEPEKEIAKYAIGDTVETDLVVFTLDNAEFAIALENSLPVGAGFTLDNDYFLPKEYDEEEDKNNPYVAPKGHTLVSITFTAENLDRDFLYLDDGMAADNNFITVEYDGAEYTSESFAEKEYGWTVDQDGKWSSTPVVGILLGKNGAETTRGYVDIPVDVSSLNDSFEIIFNLPQSDGTTAAFTFVK